MQVKDVIASALRLIGRAELIPHVSDPSNAIDEDAGEVIETLLYCFNAVEDELARKYFPLVISEELRSTENKFFFSGFSFFPVKIRKVTVDGKKAKFKVYSKYIYVEAETIAVEYEFAPERKTISDSSYYEGEVGEHLIALGMASEYSVINGEGELADRWENKYRKQIDSVRLTPSVCHSIPPRRWV